MLIIALFLVNFPRAWAIDPLPPAVKCDQVSGVSVYPKCEDQLTPGSRSGLAAPSGFGLAVFYVVPADVEFDPNVLATLKQSSRNVQAWYELATGGRTWAFSSPDVVQVYRARENRQYYVDNGNWWGSLLTEMSQAGLPIWSPGTVTAIWAHGAGFWAGGAPGCQGQCGTVLLGVELFPQFNNPAYSGGNCPDPDGEGVEAFPCNPVGAFAHELGHPLGMGHPFDDPALRDVAGHSIMATHWNFSDQAPPQERPWGLLTAERQFIHDNPFLGERSGVAQIYENLDVSVNLPVSGALPNSAFDVLVQGNVVKVTAKDTTYRDYLWTFGDSTSAHGVSAEHVYSAPGTYIVRLRVSSNESMMSATENTIEVSVSAPACGTVKKNTRLKCNCLGPLKVGADRITVNLNGHSVLAQSGQPGVEVIGRRGVTIKNGTINGHTVGLLAKDGCSNTFRDLKIFSEGESTPNVQIENANYTVIKQITCERPRFDVTPFKFSGMKSTISRVSCQGESSNGAIILGDRLTVSDNDFRVVGDNSLRGLYFKGSKSLLRGNFVANKSERVQYPALVVFGDDNVVRQNKVSGVIAGFGLACGSRRNVIQKNCVTVDDQLPGSLAINGGKTACENTWRNNHFTTDSEGDGPKAGCIQ
jgi:PKD repeat protein